MSAIYDDYDDYQYICKINNIKPMNIGSESRNHLEEILSNMGFKDKYDYFTSLRKMQKRDKIISEVMK